MKGPAAQATHSDSRWGLATLAYSLLIVYGSLYPFSGWTIPQVRLFSFLSIGWQGHLSRADVVTNLLAYMPLGLLLARWRRSRNASGFGAAVTAILLAGLLSFAMESTQQFLPARVASLSDLIANTIGATVGAALARITHSESLPWMFLMERRERWFRPGRLVDLGLIAIALWTLSQLTPLVPSLDLGNLRHGLSPIWQTLQHPSRFNFGQWATYVFYLTGLALLAVLLGSASQAVFARFFAFVACVLLCKIVIVTRQLSLEAAGGALIALILALPFQALRPRGLATASALFILAGFAIAELASDPAGMVQPFNWVPLAGHLENPLIGIASILEEVWPAAALASIARLMTPQELRWRIAWLGVPVIACIAFGLEWYQQYLPGRYGDFTVVLLMACTWLSFWSVPLRGADGRDLQTVVPTASARKTPRTWAVAGAFGLAVAAGAAGLVLGQRSSVEVRVDESKHPQLPAPDQLPPVSLPEFGYAHPRLPSPTQADLTMLTKKPEFVRQVRSRADRGDFDATFLQEVLEPGSVDLGLLHRRLIELKFAFRGNDQVKPLALAYDWLYGRWSETQRAQLRTKLLEGCNYEIELIRKDRLSPYNVILYNSPLQALMACALAAYGDDPRADPIMRFTYDLWMNRVLPVWRQVMGRNGGWHEGGEYVAVGIGQAVYELPAMWRKATGMDLFATEPGICGFLDFLAYRRRPDNTDFRWGDASAFDKIVPDATPLALELRHAPAYSLRPPATDGTPTSWPWGPLSNSSFLTPAPLQTLALTRLFEGLGLLVARSDWSPDATYVTFKAGDNYWSHSHLDQGAFTIYKGGELAIDSGLYGPSYGSDHHMNYTYQTIAHNVITVTDPDDTVPAPGKDKPRPIANDGGQRRIGSGWGVEAAPLDRNEWEAKSAIYHTGAMGPLLDQGGLSVAAADITPAYTNERSGSGTFSARTRRVERFWRIFGYDRVDDVVVVFDQVTATKSSFRKRWLLHTIEEPVLLKDGSFRIGVQPTDQPGHGGGALHGTVLLPKDALINPVGGRGLEFFVDDKNYDENGKLLETMHGAKGIEAGAWRLEVTPPADAKDDSFLVVLLPTAGSTEPLHQVRLLESGKKIGCEIAGPNRTTRWWFEPGRNRAEIEVTSGADAHRYEVRGPETAVPTAPSWTTQITKALGIGSVH